MEAQPAIAPCAVIASALWARGNAVAPVLALGPASYSLYMYVQYIVGPQYERYSGNTRISFRCISRSSFSRGVSPLRRAGVVVAVGLLRRATWVSRLACAC